MVSLKKITTEGARYPCQVSSQADKENQTTIFCHTYVKQSFCNSDAFFENIYTSKIWFSCYHINAS